MMSQGFARMHCKGPGGLSSGKAARAEAVTVNPVSLVYIHAHRQALVPTHTYMSKDTYSAETHAPPTCINTYKKV